MPTTEVRYVRACLVRLGRLLRRWKVLRKERAAIVAEQQRLEAAEMTAEGLTQANAGEVLAAWKALSARSNDYRAAMQKCAEKLMAEVPRHQRARRLIRRANLEGRDWLTDRWRLRFLAMQDQLQAAIGEMVQPREPG